MPKRKQEAEEAPVPTVDYAARNEAYLAVGAKVDEVRDGRRDPIMPFDSHPAPQDGLARPAFLLRRRGEALAEIEEGADRAGTRTAQD